MFELFELLTKVNAQILRALSPLVKGYGLTVSELIILWKINKQGSCKITDFAKGTGVPASTLTSLFDRLEAKELVERTHDENDRRCILINGTPKLTDLIHEAILMADEKLSPIQEGLSANFVDGLLKDLQTLQEQLKLIT